MFVMSQPAPYLLPVTTITVYIVYVSFTSHDLMYKRHKRYKRASTSTYYREQVNLVKFDTLDHSLLIR